MATKVVKVPLKVGNEQHRFAPEEITVKVGDTVRWENEDTALHTVTPQDATAFPAGTLDEQGSTFSHQFDAAGEFPYFCEIHGSMNGVIKVEADDNSC